jgi:hypothetical protein
MVQTKATNGMTPEAHVELRGVERRTQIDKKEGNKVTKRLVDDGARRSE